jgi:hypothetical protein
MTGGERRASSKNQKVWRMACGGWVGCGGGGGPGSAPPGIWAAYHATRRYSSCAYAASYLFPCHARRSPAW